MAYYSPEKRRENQKQWEERIEDWKGSALSGAAWCRREGVTYCQFLYWKSRLTRQPSPKNNSQPFIEIEDTADISGVEVLIGDFSIRVSKNFDPTTLCNCVRTLSGISC